VGPGRKENWNELERSCRMILETEEAVNVIKACLITSAIVENLDADIDEFFEGNKKSKEEYFDVLYKTIELFNLGGISESIDSIVRENDVISSNIMDLIHEISLKSTLEIEKDEIVSGKFYNSYVGV